jgi:phage terminase small subunit
MSSDTQETTEDKQIALSETKAAFALHLATTGNKAAAARAAGYEGEHARQRGHRMALDPEVQEAVAKIQEFTAVEITEDFIKSALMREALQAGGSRDRREALHLLGKTKGMFKDVVEQTNMSGDLTTLIQEARKTLGDDIADRMAEELGLEPAD